jgi:peptide/nickel transport system permease protein
MRLSGRVGAGLLAGVGVIWCMALLGGYDVIADVHPGLGSSSASTAHWLGTDHLGRDVFWRAVVASKAFVGPGVLACLAAVIVAVPAGALSGYYGGRLAVFIRYISTVTASLPRFVLVLLCMAIYGNDLWLLAIVAGFSYVPTLAEAVHARVQSLAKDEFVLAARAHGTSEGRILLYHLLWVNCRRLVARHGLQLFGYFLLLETTLSYIGGFGVTEPQPSWGNMLAFDFGYQEGNYWGVVAPAALIWLTIFGCALLAEELVEREGA